MFLFGRIGPKDVAISSACGKVAPLPVFLNVPIAVLEFLKGLWTWVEFLLETEVLLLRGGLTGRAGLCSRRSLVSCGDTITLSCPSESWSFLKLIREWCLGGGSNGTTGVKDLACNCVVTGPFPNIGPGEGPSSGLLPLLGGVLNGEAFSSNNSRFAGVRAEGSTLLPRTDCLLDIMGFSARLTWGGGPFEFLAEASRRSSPDLRGGGGSGGCTAGNVSDFRGSSNGV
jgi:hypothetical protein